MKTTFKIWLTSGLAVALVLSAGCSGSSGNDLDVGNNTGGYPTTAGPGTVPDSAGTSVASFLAYLLGLDPNDETSEPLLIQDAFAVPTDESGDSQPLT